jgi:hypothetical protein
VRKEGTYQVDYDAETKTLLYEPELGIGGQDSGGQDSDSQDSGGQVTALKARESEQSAEPSSVSVTPAKSAGQQAIDKLVERLEQEGKGKEVAKLIVRYGGYGQNPEAARELYSKLRALLVGQES